MVLMGSLQCVVENPSIYPKLTIVYHLSTSGTLVNARKPLCNMTASTWQPTYIYIKEIRIHNSMRYKVDKVFVLVLLFTLIKLCGSYVCG
jgi:hypothetical protein